MRLIDIDLSKEPECLKSLRAARKTYDDLKDECKKEVTKLLKSEQKGFCAYCEQKFKFDVQIEHYVSQKEDQDQDLVYSNFLGVCSGKYYLDKMTGKHIEHCDTSRGSQTLQLNPKLVDHINTIYYNEKSEIRSTNPDFENDLNNVLNLNFEEFVDLRTTEFNNNFDNLLKVANQLKLSKKEAFEKGLKNSDSGNAEFPSYLGYRYKMLLENLSD